MTATPLKAFHVGPPFGVITCVQVRPSQCWASVLAVSSPVTATPTAHTSELVVPAMAVSTSPACPIRGLETVVQAGRHPEVPAAGSASPAGAEATNDATTPTKRDHREHRRRGMARCYGDDVLAINRNPKTASASARIRPGDRAR